MTSLISNVGKTVGIGILGALAAKEGSLLSRKVVNLTGYAIGKPLDILPMSVQYKMFQVASAIGKVANALHAPFVRAGVSENAYSTFLAPILEEIPYRLILQEGSSKALQSAGVDPTVAKVIAIGATTILFGMAHNPDVTSEQFSSVALQGLAFGITQEVSGTSEAIIAHGVSNGIINYL